VVGVFERGDRLECGLPEDDEMPELASPEDLRYLISFGSITVHEPNKKGVCELGLSFGCSWEEEHGLGVRLRNNKVVEVGYAEVAL
jgi:hypothetical protein